MIYLWAAWDFPACGYRFHGDSVCVIHSYTLQTSRDALKSRLRWICTGKYPWCICKWLTCNKELRLYNGFLYLYLFTFTTCFDHLQASRINLQRKGTSFQLRTGTTLYEYFTYAEHCNIEKLRVYIPRKNSVIPLLILFKICGSVRLCTLFVILYKLPEGGWLYTTLKTFGTSD